MNTPVLKTKYRISGCKSCNTIGCKVCGNTGRIMQINVDWFVECEECDGMGEYDVYKDYTMQDCHTQTCPECLGTGDIPLDMVG